MMVAKHGIKCSPPGTADLMRAASFAASIVLLAACNANTPPSQTGTTTSGLTAGGSTDTGTYSTDDVKTAYDRAQKIRDLLATCSGPSASLAAVEANNMQHAQVELSKILLSTTLNTAANRDHAVNAMLELQADAYDAAVACGLVQPGVPDPGGWNATWDDISS